MSWRGVHYRLSLLSRRKKFDLFWDLLQPATRKLVVNLGATPPHVGRAMTGAQQEDCMEQPEQDPRWERLVVIGINLDEENSRAYRDHYGRQDRIGFVADGCQLPFADQSVDIVFANAVIEHVPRERQARFAQEIMRVGRSWFVTTPNYWYPYEFHYKLPAVHYLPAGLRSRVQRRFSSWPENEPIALLSAKELNRLFPGARILKPRVTFWPETLIAYHAAANGTD